MGVILADSVLEERSEYCNWWNWRPTVELIRASGLLDNERLELMGYNAGAEVTEQEARAISKFLEDRVLSGLNSDERVLLDLAVTGEPDDGTFYRDPEEHHKNYGASREWLQKFAAFCKECHGFTVL
jgi:hypothetical protein